MHCHLPLLRASASFERLFPQIARSFARTLLPVPSRSNKVFHASAIRERHENEQMWNFRRKRCRLKNYSLISQTLSSKETSADLQAKNAGS